MHIEIPQPIRNFLTSTKFWKNNFLILREFKHFQKIALLALVFSFLAATFEGVSIGFLLSFLQSLTNPNAKPPQTGIAWFDITILGINTSVANRLYRISALILLTTWIRAAFNYFAQVYTDISQQSLVERLRRQIFEQLQSFSLSYFSQTRGGELLNTITTEIEKIQQVFSASSFLITRSLTISVYVISLLLLSWPLTIISILLFTLLGVGLSTLNSRVREKSFGTTKASGQFTSILVELINGMRTVHAFGTQDFERKRFYKATSDILAANTKVTLIWTTVRPLAECLGVTILISMIIVAYTGGGIGVKLQVESLLTFFFVLFRLVPILQEINGTRAFLSTLQGSADNIKELLRTDNKKYFQNGTRQYTTLKHGIDFISVDFAYDDTNLVLHNVKLTIERGKMTALVGKSGAGKTTIADLIPRFYDPTAGKILLDGVDLREFEISSLRRNLAVVSQDTFIFNTSVWNNIAYGSFDATNAEIRQAALLANALEFIEEMPEGFDTQLGDRGVRLSGGQRQRLAIARALLRNPEILILDEATSALDSVSERLIQDSIEKLAVGRTVIAIAHRLSTIVRADKVVVLEQGRVVEQGSYQDLLEQRGQLWKYHEMQHQTGSVG